MSWRPWATRTGRSELQAIRQGLCRIRSLKMLRLGDEGAWLSQMALVGALAIQRLWDDDTVTEARARVLSDWAVDHLMPWPLDWQDSIAEGRWNDIELLMAQCLVPLALCAPVFPVWLRPVAGREVDSAPARHDASGLGYLGRNAG